MKQENKEMIANDLVADFFDEFKKRFKEVYGDKLPKFLRFETRLVCLDDNDLHNAATLSDVKADERYLTFFRYTFLNSDLLLDDEDFEKLSNFEYHGK